MRGWTSHLSAPFGWGMIDIRDSRGITTFIVRFLLFYMVALLVSSFPLLPGLTFLLSIGIMGFFTFIQVMASISRKFLDQPVAWKAAVIAGAIVFDGAVLWLLGLLLVVVFDGGSAWIAVAERPPAHAFAALCAWGLREIIHALGSLNTAAPSALASPAPQDGKIDPAHSDVRDTDALLTAPAKIEADTINR